MSKRLYYFDNLKTAIILLIVAFHCAMGYMAYAPKWWYVLDSQNSVLFTWFVIWADNFIMPIMFFISGYLGLKSLRKWNTAAFWGKKLWRIGLPWLTGMIFFVPYIIWLWFFSRDISITFYDLIVKQYFGPFYQQGVYWYLSALMALYFILFCFVKVYPAFLIQPDKSQIQTFKLSYFFIYLVVATISMFIINMYYPDGYWLNVGYVLLVQITRAPIYLASFFFGAYCERNRLLHNIDDSKIIFDYKFLISVFIIMSVLFVYFRMNYDVKNNFGLFINAFIHCVFCLLSLLTAICVFRRFLNWTSGFLSALAIISYPIYFIHQDIVQTLVLWARPLEFNIYIKYIIALAISLVFCYASCQGGLKKLPFFKDLR